jgi:hypothetical protein
VFFFNLFPDACGRTWNHVPTPWTPKWRRRLSCSLFSLSLKRGNLHVQYFSLALFCAGFVPQVNSCLFPISVDFVKKKEPDGVMKCLSIFPFMNELANCRLSQISFFFEFAISQSNFASGLRQFVSVPGLQEDGLVFTFHMQVFLGSYLESLMGGRSKNFCVQIKTLVNK